MSSVPAPAEFEVPVAVAPGSSNSTGEKQIVDFADFEHQKENIQPLRRGRSAQTLSLLYGSKDKQRDVLGSSSRHSLQPQRLLDTENMWTSEVQERNARFQREIAEMDVAETDDPLDVYFRYVQWLLEVSPQARGSQMIVRLVEQPLRLFRQEERYRNDARFVKLWIWYTEIIEDSTREAVFQFLVANRIGDSLAVLYEAYAGLLEETGKVRRADEIFQLGVARKAQPVARLKRRFDEFQRRVVARTVRDVDQQKQPQQQAGEAGGVQPTERGQRTDENDPRGRGNAGQRTMLGTKRSSRSVRSAAANTLPQAQRGLQSAGSAVSRPNSRISVFADSPADAQSSERRPAAGGPWLDIGSDEGRRKENIPEAASWRGQTLEQKRAGAVSGGGVQRPAREKFTVFSDNAEDAGSGSGRDSQSGAAVLAPKPQAEGSSAADLLQPLDGSADAKPTRSKAKGKDKAAKKDGAKREERIVMSDQLLESLRSGGAPMCAEIARAQLAVYRFDYGAWEQQEQQQQQQQQTEASEASSDEDQGIADESGFGAHSRRKSVAPSSPTINTRVAQKDMLGIWNSFSDDEDDSDEERRDGGSAADDDYQFTMGPVTPNVVPRGQARLPPVIPTSARPGTRTRPANENDDAPTVVLNSIRAAKRQEMRLASRPTPLATRAQTPQPATGRRRVLAGIDESSEEDEGPLMQALGGRRAEARPLPLFGGRSHSASHLECDYPPIREQAGSRAMAQGSGAELTSMSGFTGLSTIGPGTASTFMTPGGGQRQVLLSEDDDDDEVEEEVEERGVGQTPMRKRLSMAAKDLGRITPRFPKTPPAGSGDAEHASNDDDDDDDDDDEPDDDDDPCTENIGEFADLDSQMNELQMELGAKFLHQESPPMALQDDGPASSKRAPLFTIFRD